MFPPTNSTGLRNGDSIAWDSRLGCPRAGRMPAPTKTGCYKILIPQRRSCLYSKCLTVARKRLATLKRGFWIPLKRPADHRSLSPVMVLHDCHDLSCLMPRHRRRLRPPSLRKVSWAAAVRPRLARPVVRIDTERTITPSHDRSVLTTILSFRDFFGGTAPGSLGKNCCGVRGQGSLLTTRAIF